VARAKLVDLMTSMIPILLYLAEDPSLVVGYCVIFYRLMGKVFLQSVYYFNFIKFEDDTTAGSTLNKHLFTGISLT
jgi:hypothetical protein